MSKKAVVLFSGGLDSTTCLAIARDEGFACYAISFDFGQRHHIELNAAQQIAKKHGVIEHRIIKLGIGDLRGSAQTNSDIAIPNHSNDGKIPSTYEPAR